METCTDAEGRFEIKEIPFASYLVVVNDDDTITANQPFRRFYYPNVTARQKAQIIIIAEGVREYTLDIHVPVMKETVTVKGKALSANNKPVAFAGVAFISDQTDPTIDGRSFAMTDEQGNFSMDILKGLSGVVFASAILNPEEFKECPAILRVGGNVSLDRRTEALRLKAERRLDALDLRFSFPGCNRETIRSQRRVD